jgi:hypothetical protein
MKATKFTKEKVRNYEDGVGGKRKPLKERKRLERN